MSKNNLDRLVLLFSSGTHEEQIFEIVITPYDKDQDPLAIKLFVRGDLFGGKMSFDIEIL